MKYVCCLIYTCWNAWPQWNKTNFIRFRRLIFKAAHFCILKFVYGYKIISVIPIISVEYIWKLGNVMNILTYQSQLYITFLQVLEKWHISRLNLQKIKRGSYLWQDVFENWKHSVYFIVLENILMGDCTLKAVGSISVSEIGHIFGAPMGITLQSNVKILHIDPYFSFDILKI